MLSESKSYWVELLNKWFASNFVLSIEGVPSIEEQQKMANEEKARIEEQIEKLTEQGLLNKEEELENAIQFNERPPPDKMLTCVPIPEIKLINFHEVIRYSTDNGNRKHIDLSNTPVFTYFDHLKSNFVYVCNSYFIYETLPSKYLIVDVCFNGYNKCFFKFTFIYTTLLGTYFGISNRKRWKPSFT